MRESESEEAEADVLIKAKNKEISVIEIESCCFKINLLAVLLISSLIMSFMTVLFTFLMLYLTREDCSAQQTYSTILCTVVGVWLPSPTNFIREKRK